MLTIYEQAVVAIFHNAVFHLTASEFAAVASSKIEKVGDRAWGEGLAADVTAMLAFGNGKRAITLPSPVAGLRGIVIKTKDEPPDPLHVLTGDDIRAGRLGPPVQIVDMDGLRLISHELVHAVQIIRAGSGTAFIARYLASAGYLMGRGLSQDDAYEFSPFEIDAYAFEQALEEVLTPQRNKILFSQAVMDYTRFGRIGVYWLGKLGYQDKLDEMPDTGTQSKAGKKLAEMFRVAFANQRQQRRNTLLTKLRMATPPVPSSVLEWGKYLLPQFLF
jgi:hypothetical protein